MIANVFPYSKLNEKHATFLILHRCVRVKAGVEKCAPCKKSKANVTKCAAADVHIRSLYTLAKAMISCQKGREYPT